MKRGAMYIAVLTTTMLVMVLGLSGLTAARISMRGQETIHDAVAAGHLAQSGIEHALQMLATNGNWRGTYGHDAWVGTLPLGAGTFQWKLFDPVNGDLSDPCEPLYIIGRGTVGDTVRMLRVSAQTPRTPNLIDVGDFEEEPSINWSDSTILGSCELKHSKSAVSGSNGCLVQNRDTSSAGPALDVTDQIEFGASYQLGTWVRAGTGQTMILAILLETTHGSTVTTTGTAVASDGWEWVEGTVTVNWTGQLLAAHYVIYASGTLDGFEIDAVTFRDAAPGVEVRHGSFQRMLD